MMFSNDDRRSPGDTPFRNVGTGHYVAFQCAKCNLSKPTMGRQRKWVSRFLGKQFVCKTCAEDA